MRMIGRMMIAGALLVAHVAYERAQTQHKRCATIEEQGGVITPICQALADEYNAKYGAH